MKIRQKLLRVLGTWTSLLVFMSLFRPQNLPVAGLIIPFILLFAALYAMWDLLASLRIRYVQHAEAGNTYRQLGAAVCTTAVLLLVLQSLGQLTVRDIITLITVVLMGYVYLARNHFTVPKH